MLQMLNCVIALIFWVRLLELHAILLTIPQIHPFIFKSHKKLGQVINPIDCFILRIFGCPIYAHVNNAKLAPSGHSMCVSWFWNLVKGIQAVVS